MNPEHSPEEIEAYNASRAESDAELLSADAEAEIVHDPGAESPRVHLSDEQLDRMHGVDKNEMAMRDFKSYADKHLPKERLSLQSIDSTLEGMNLNMPENNKRRLSPEAKTIITKLQNKRHELDNHLKFFPSGQGRDAMMTIVSDVGRAIFEHMQNFSLELISEQVLMEHLKNQEKRLHTVETELDIESEGEDAE